MRIKEELVLRDGKIYTLIYCTDEGIKTISLKALKEFEMTVYEKELIEELIFKKKRTKLDQYLECKAGVRFWNNLIGISGGKE